MASLSHTSRAASPHLLLCHQKIFFLHIVTRAGVFRGKSVPQQRTDLIYQSDAQPKHVQCGRIQGHSECPGPLSRSLSLLSSVVILISKKTWF